MALSLDEGGILVAIYISGLEGVFRVMYIVGHIGVIYKIGSMRENHIL